MSSLSPSPPGLPALERRRERRTEVVLPLIPEVKENERLGPILLGIALLVILLFHGVLLFNQHFISTYDALIHIFFSAHYAESWFDPWEPRWYTGFFTVAYPPLSHYLIALSSKLVGYLTGFALVQLYALLQLTVGVYRFSRLLTRPVGAGCASVAFALSSSVAETVHVFGQLPTILALSFLLNTIPFVWSYLRFGRKRDLLKAVIWTAATTAAHHVTTLFGSVFFTGPIVIMLLLRAFRSPRPNEPEGEGLMPRFQRRVYRLLPRLYRTFVFGVLAISMLIIVVLPYWYWSGTDPILQVPIPHGSRENFLARPDLGLIFWVIPWLSSIWFLPYALYKGTSGSRWPIAASLALLFILGTGDTTPLPRLLLRGAFDILTLDRFTFWATMLILPFIGMAIDSAFKGELKGHIDSLFGRRVRLAFLIVALLASSAVALSISTLTRYRKIQPDPIDIEPIVNFIEKDEHWRYRYLTLGFGDQMAWLAANTRATTPDGNYHSARRLPELTTTPVERLEGAKYKDVPGIGSLEQFLQTPEKYRLKFVFSNDNFYDPILYFNGWHSLGKLSNGIEVWEREGFPPLPERLPRKTWPIYQRIMWGTLPMLAFILAYFVLLLPSKNDKLRVWQQRGLAKRLHTYLQEDALEEQDASIKRPLKSKITSQHIKDFFFKPQQIRIYALLSLSFLIFFATTSYLSYQRAQDKPEKAVIAYWDHIDFKRFGDAYTWLEPIDGLDFDRWLLDISVVGGLRTGYSQLNDIETELIAYEGEGSLESPKVGDRALVQTDLRWFTSVTVADESLYHELLRTDKGWRILASPTLKARPQERFTGQADLSYYRSPRRLTTGTTSAADVLDKPRLVVLDARLVSYDATRPNFRSNEEEEVTQFSIVGQIQNVDARPADLTVTAALRDVEGNALSYNNAGSLVLHKLLPGETTPFRIDFDGVSAPLDPQNVIGFDLYPNSVVTAYDLERDLASWTQAKDDTLELRVVNLGTREATVPHALLSLFDDEGLSWLSETFLTEALPPREAQTLNLPLTLPPNYQLLSRYDPSRLNSAADDQRVIKEPINFALEHDLLNAYLVQFNAFYRGDK